MQKIWAIANVLKGIFPLITQCICNVRSAPQAVNLVQANRSVLNALHPRHGCHLNKVVFARMATMKMVKSNAHNAHRDVKSVKEGLINALNVMKRKS